MPGVNFTNILRTALIQADLKSAKNTVKPLMNFWDQVKAARKSWA